jgi:hypothetical protein
MQYWVVRPKRSERGVRRAGPHRVYGSYDSAVLDGVLEVDAIQPVGACRTQHGHDEV